MRTALELRPVAKTEVSNGGVITMRLADQTQLDIGIRMRTGFGIRHFLFGVLQVIQEDRLFATALYDAGMRSRNLEGGHGYIVLYTDKVVVPWTRWSEEDREPGYSQKRPWDNIIYDLVPETQQRLRKMVADTADMLEIIARSIKSDVQLPGPYQI